MNSGVGGGAEAIVLDTPALSRRLHVNGRKAAPPRASCPTAAGANAF